MKKLTRDEFIKKSNSVHGHKYNYDKVVYVGSHTPVIITCPIHGDFKQKPYSHLQGKGCGCCANNNKKKLIYGVGVNDYEGTTKQNGKHIHSYGAWRDMLKRCYDKKWHRKHPSYAGCFACDEWLTFSNFKKWFENPENGYIEGYQLDKDIRVKGNKCYSPETCCFVPKEINLIIIKNQKHKNINPVGVSSYNTSKSERYKASVSINGKAKCFGSFDTSDEAFTAYKINKEKHIQDVASKYYSACKITKIVYDALMNYKVE